MQNVKLHPEADNEIAVAANYIESRRENFGAIFKIELLKTFASIAADPERWKVRRNGYRKYTIQRFGYQVWFKERGKEVFVIAVHHGRRGPGFWKKRILDDEQR